MEINEETLKELLARITDYGLSINCWFDVAYDLRYENNFNDKKSSEFFSQADELGAKALSSEKMIEKKTIKLSDDKLSDVNLFILLKRTIRQKETDKALKLVNMLYDRFEDLYVEYGNLKNELKLCRKMNMIKRGGINDY